MLGLGLGLGARVWCCVQTRLQVCAALLTKVYIEPYKQWGSICSRGSPLVLARTGVPPSPRIGGSGSTSPGGSTVPPTPVIAHG